MADEKGRGLSRRDLLKQVGLAGAAAAVPVTGLTTRSTTPEVVQQRVAGPAARREPVENLTAAESDLLEAICARLIPTDANGPGAREARAAHYIDRALGGFLASSKPAYTAGLAALDRYARSSRGGPFTTLSARDQDSLLIDVETGSATGFPTSSAAFFAMVRTHTIQGTFSDPYYGGNANFVGWDLIGYPGVRTNVTADDQRLGAAVAPNHKSAYDYEMFTKATARLRQGFGGQAHDEDHSHGN
jgi:gluconate 2-dehydrogenase gamma chain